MPLVLQDYWDHEERGDSLERKVIRDPRVFQDSQDQVDHLDLLVFQGIKVKQAHLVNLATQERETQDPLVILVLKVTLVKVALLGSQGNQGNLGLQVLQDHLLRILTSDRSSL